MRVAIVGYGRMGREVEKAALLRGHEVEARVDPVCGDFATLSAGALGEAEIALEFTGPETAPDNVVRLARLGLDVVCGSTGWYDRMEEVRAAVEEADVGVVWAPNFSIGVNLFWRLIEEAARLFSRTDAGAAVFEVHHSAKRDAPSGTALRIVEILRDGGFDLPDSAVASLRTGHFPGTHTVVFDLPHETVELSHVARSRACFAYGAVMAAELLRGRKGLVSFTDLLRDGLFGG
mgnify:CR=1 FL=1